MPNNPANDRYNPPSALDNDYELTKFSEVVVGELIWINNIRSDSNHSYRKTSEYEAMNVHTRETKSFNKNDKVYYRI